MKRRLLLTVLPLAAMFLAMAWLSCSRQQAGMVMKQEDRLTLAQDLASRGKCAKAILQYEKLLSEFPKPQIAETAKFNLARCRMEIGAYDLAITEFEDFTNAYPRSDLVDNSMYMIALCYLKQSPRVERDQTKTVQALDELSLLLRKYPDTDVKSDVQRSLNEARSKLAKKEYMNGDLYLRLGDYRSARIYFDYVISEYRDTPWAALALLEEGTAFEREGRPDEARRVYKQVIGDFPSSSSSDRATQRLKELGGGSDTETETSSQK